MFSKNKIVGDSNGGGSSSSAFPISYIRWPNGLSVPTTTSARLISPLQCRDDADSFDIEFTSNSDASINVDGIGGINTNQFPATADTFYNIRALNDSSAANSPAIELIKFGVPEPALPAGYDKSVILYPPVTTDAAGTSLVQHKFTVVGQSILVYLNLDRADSQILNAGNATSNATLSTAPLLPQGRRMIGIFAIEFDNDGNASNRLVFGAPELNVNSAFPEQIQIGIGVSSSFRHVRETPLDQSSNLVYQVTTSGNAATIGIVGYTMSTRFDD